MTHVCISPGSRSTPLAVAAARTSGITTSIHLDERVSAFTALGRAVATGSPVGLLCTSGTAGANFLPAISEASLSHVPLIAMTADRPPEHQSWGVGQTFEQTGLFHQQVRAQFTMPVGGDGGMGFSHRSGWRAAVTAVEDAGPVHVNWPFRLPLEPAGRASEVEPAFGPPARSSWQLHVEEVERLSALLAKVAHPVVVAGPHALIGERGRRKQLFQAATAAGVPLLADALSGLRGSNARALISRPALVTHRWEHDSLRADLVIHIGQTPTAKALRLWWESIGAEHALIDPRREWHDPSHLVNHRFTSEPIQLLVEALNSCSFEAGHLDSWSAAGEAADRACTEVMMTWPESHEARVAETLAHHATSDDVIVTSSSMPVRDIDMFAPVSCTAQVSANRGVNGIDGVVSTASGVAAARTSGRTFVLIGDVALLHDVGGVLDAARNRTPLTVIVVNNDGGAIFNHLPAREALDNDTFTRLFTTPHGTTFEFLGNYPGVSYVAASDLDTGLAAVADESTEPVTVIEIATDSSTRPAQQRDLVDRIRQ